MAAPANEKKDILVLVVDDDSDVRGFFSDYLSRQGFKVESVSNGHDATEFLQRSGPDAILLDLRLPDINGIDILRKAKELRPETAVIVMTGFATVESSVEAMRLGAWNYHVKPIDDPSEIAAELVEAVPAVTTEPPSEREGRTRRIHLSPFLVGDTPAMRHVLDLAGRAAAVDSSVLICGESGTGKELVARLIHENCHRKNGKFLPVNCGAVADTLLESTLFGYERGAFTGAYKRTKGYFEAADGGTLFLDEIADTSLRLQTKLLRALEEHAFQRVGGTDTVVTDARIIAATNRNLEKELQAGRFREDLYYRINVLNINMPPLRERTNDIRPLVTYFLRKHGDRMGRTARGFTEDTLRRLEAYRWPGNVRELENVVERALAFKDGDDLLKLESLPPTLGGAAPSREDIIERLQPFAQAKEQFEMDYITRLLQEAGGNVSAAARMAGIARQNLYAKIRKYGLSTKPD